MWRNHGRVCCSVVRVDVSESSGADRGNGSGESVPFPWSYGKYGRGFPGVFFQ